MRKIGLIRALLLTHKADKLPTERRLVLRQERLQKLVDYVRANSPYFADLYKWLDHKINLTDLPTTNKIMMMENFDEWLTDRAVTKGKVEIFMSDLSNVGKKLDGKYLVYTTSGSTGSPCIVLYDDTAINVSSAIGVLRSFARKSDLRAFMKSGGKTIALFADNGFYLGTGSVKHTLRKMPWKKKKMKTFDVRNPIAKITDVLNEYQPSMIGCYPTAMELLATEQENGNLHISPSIIMTGGEKLNDDVRERLSKTFGCYIQTNYSCTEGGTIACECAEKHFHINDDWVIVEAVDENNNPVPFGTQSAKILLTNLANRICPIIRFEITDRVTIYNELCKCGNPRMWLTLEGRTDDILQFSNGVRIAPLSLYVVLKEIKGIERFQIVQQDNDKLELRITASNRQTVFESAKTAVEKYLSQNRVDAEVYLSDKSPETNPISGKFKHIIAK